MYSISHPTSSCCMWTRSITLVIPLFSNHNQTYRNDGVPQISVSTSTHPFRTRRGKYRILIISIPQVNPGSVSGTELPTSLRLQGFLHLLVGNRIGIRPLQSQRFHLHCPIQTSQFFRTTKPHHGPLPLLASGRKIVYHFPDSSILRPRYIRISMSLIIPSSPKPQRIGIRVCLPWVMDHVPHQVTLLVRHSHNPSD